MRMRQETPQLIGRPPASRDRAIARKVGGPCGTVPDEVSPMTWQLTHHRWANSPPLAVSAADAGDTVATPADRISAKATKARVTRGTSRGITDRVTKSATFIAASG